MKIRNGFISNSSSSSFIVVFPKKPRSAKEVLKWMFGGKKYDIKPYDYSVSTQKIAETVFSDISGKIEKLTLEKITEEFRDRYYFSEWSGWINRHDKYFGTNIQHLMELEDLYMQRIRKAKEIREKHFAIQGDCPVPKVPFAAENCFLENKKPPTKKAIKAYKEYDKKYHAYLDNHEEYQKLKKQLDAMNNEYYGKIRILEEQIAKEDAKVFYKDTKGKFIFRVEYSDNDGEFGSLMEHGDIFQSVPHITISHH